jgi:hypothetical protein
MKKANCGDCCGGLGWDQLRGGWWWTVEEDGGNLEEEEATIVSWPPWRWRADGLMMAEERERGTEIPLLLVGVMVTMMKMKGCSLVVEQRLK